MIRDQRNRLEAGSQGDAVLSGENEHGGSDGVPLVPDGTTLHYDNVVLKRIGPN